MGFINTLEKIFRGTTAGDTTGTPARTAAQMLNSNMDKIDSALAEIDTAAEKKANKVNNLDAPNATQYPTSQAVSNAVSGIQSAAESSTDSKLLAYQKTSEKGSTNGYAPLDANAKVPPANTYAVMDEIIEGEYINATTFNDEFGNPVSPGSAKLYQDTTTGNPTSQQQFRWSGTQFSPIPSSPGTTDEVPEGATNQYFTADRVRAVVLTGYEVVTDFFVSATDNIVTAIGKLQGQINTLSNSIGNKLDKGTYTGNAGDLKTLIDGKETPLGAQSKADAAETNAKAYTDARETVLQGNIDGKANTRLSNVASDLSTAEQDAIRAKLGVAPEKKYGTIALLLADQVNQVENKIYYVEDASGWTDRNLTGWAAFQKKAASTNAQSDYTLREFEGMENALIKVPDNGETIGANNVKTNNIYATINPDLKMCFIAHGGHIDFPNIIGSFNGSGANYSIISGGYDNKVDVIAGTISGGAHHRIHGNEANSSHNTIAGGSSHEIERGEYSYIGGGRLNKIKKIKIDGTTLVVPSHSVISGGGENTINAGNATIGGGVNNTNDGDSATIAGGQLCSAEGNFDVISGGGNNRTSKGVGFGQKNTIGGGRYNLISSTTNPIGNVIDGGENNETYGNNNTVGGGKGNIVGNNTSDSTATTISGGLDNKARGVSATVSGGRENEAIESYSTVTGGRGNKTTTLYSRAHGLDAIARHQSADTLANGKFFVSGDAQTTTLVSKLQNTTSSGSFSNLTTIALIDNSTYMFEASIVARSVGVINESGAFKITGCIDRNTGASTTSLVGTPQITVLARDIVDWDVNVIANGSSGGITFQVKGDNGKNIGWVARVILTEISV